MNIYVCTLRKYFIIKWYRLLRVSGRDLEQLEEKDIDPMIMGKNLFIFRYMFHISGNRSHIRDTVFMEIGI